MSTVAILNLSLALLVVVGIVSLLAWGIVADKAHGASSKVIALGAQRPESPRPSRLRSSRIRYAGDRTA